MLASEDRIFGANSDDGSPGMTVLLNSQWQASGNGHRYPIGAERIRGMLSDTSDLRSRLAADHPTPNPPDYPDDDGGLARGGERQVHVNEPWYERTNLVVPDISFELGASIVSDGVRHRDEILQSPEATDSALTGFSEPLYNLGCDCGGELVPISRLNAVHDGALRVIWFDAHPDLNTVETSRSHNFHGMVLRALMGDIPRPFSAFLTQTLKAENVVLAGVREVDAAEREFIDRKSIRVIPVPTLSAGVDFDQLSALEGGPVYVHVDYDVLDPLAHKDAVYQVPDGLPVATLVEWLQAIRSRFHVVGFGLTEFAPRSACSDALDVEAILADGFGLPLR